MKTTRWAPGLRWVLERQTSAANFGCSCDWQVFQSIGENSSVNVQLWQIRQIFYFFSVEHKGFGAFWLTLFSLFVMARESAGSDRLRSEIYANNLFSSSGSGGFSVSSWGRTVADGAGLSLRTVEPSAQLPLSDQLKAVQGDLPIFIDVKYLVSYKIHW